MCRHRHTLPPICRQKHRRTEKVSAEVSTWHLHKRSEKIGRASTSFSARRRAVQIIFAAYSPKAHLYALQSPNKRISSAKSHLLPSRRLPPPRSPAPVAASPSPATASLAHLHTSGSHRCYPVSPRLLRHPPPSEQPPPLLAHTASPDSPQLQPATAGIRNPNHVRRLAYHRDDHRLATLLIT